MTPKASQRIPALVIALGITSMLTDMSSEMIYPLLPAFLTQVLGASPAVIGLIEGLAESTSSLVKVLSGSMADRIPRRKPLVVTGYAIAGAVRPLVAFASSWPMVLVIRFFDRIGKGIRSAPRDALLADATPPSIRGSAYGMQRALDHVGAVVGPVAASFFTGILALEYRSVFLIAAIPSLVAIAVLVFFVNEPARKTNTIESSAPRKTLKSLTVDWKELPAKLKLFLVALFIFTMGNSTDAFLLLQLHRSGVPVSAAALVWAGLHLVKVMATWQGGKLADRFSPRKLMLAGWIWYAAVYLGFAFTDEPVWVLLLFGLYGIHFGFAEPAERALVAHLAPQHLRGTAFGLFHFIIGIAALPASILFGWIFQTFSPGTAFATGAALAIAASLVIWRGIRNEEHPS
jgi:MFS family permease